MPTVKDQLEFIYLIYNRNKIEKSLFVEWVQKNVYYFDLKAPSGSYDGFTGLIEAVHRFAKVWGKPQKRRNRNVLDNISC